MVNVDAANDEVGKEDGRRNGVVDDSTRGGVDGDGDV